jgi:hypothetical protein
VTSLASLSAPGTLPTYRSLRWIALEQRFAQFHRDLLLTPRQWLDGVNKRAGVVNCPNRAYYGLPKHLFRDIDAIVGRDRE